MIIINWCNYWFAIKIFCGSSHGPHLPMPPDERDQSVYEYKPTPDNTGFVYGYEGNKLNMHCYSASTYRYHQWYQGYKDTALKTTSIIPQQAGVKISHYKMTLEKFDDNTSIYCEKETYYNYEGNHLTLMYVTSIIVIYNKTEKPTDELPTLTYSLTKNALFSCEKYKNIAQGNVHVGVINMTSNTIIAHNRKSIEAHGNFNITHSRTTVLCCIYYEVVRKEEETWITRHVTDKTLLIHEDDMKNISLDNVPSSPPSRPPPSYPQTHIPPTTIVHPSINNSPEGVQNITCIHRYQNVTGNQQKEIAKYTKPVPIQRKIDRSFFITMEKFDNNTEIYCVKDKNKPPLINGPIFALIGAKTNVLKFSTDDTYFSKTILKVNRTQTINEELENLKYNETKNVSFNCQEHNEHTTKTNYIQLGIINETSNMIETSLETTMNQTFNITHNGTILCCIYYVNYECNTTRFVTNKTLLVYDDGNQNGHPENIPEDNDITNGANRNSPESVSNQTKIYRVIAAVAITVFIILLIVIVIWKRGCRKKLKSNQKVLYADLDHVRLTVTSASTGAAIRPRPNPEDESPYAQIIGEMRPQ